MTNNPTIDGVLVPRELLSAYIERAKGYDDATLRSGLLAILDADIPASVAPAPVESGITVEEVLNKLGYFIGAHYGTQKAFADAMGCSCPFVSQVFSRKRIPNSWLTLIGIKKTITKNYEIVDATAALNGPAK